jgi:alcohol dehydrogenase
MAEYQIQHMTPVLFGEGAAKQTGAKLKEFGCTKVIFIYDQGIKKTGMAEPIIASAEAAGIKTCRFEGVLPDPADDMIDTAGELARKEQVDGVVAIGGGSSMDTSKAVNLLLTNPPPLKQYMRMGAKLKPGKVLILIPTTSGTGSEVTAVAVISDAQTHMKGGLGGPLTRATLAIVDPVLASGMPPSITADTGMDVFAHAVSSITANRHNQMSDILGEAAIKILWKYLPIAVKDGKNMEARSQMAFASMIAGYAFQDSMTQLEHAIGHTLGSLFHIPHGNACGVCLGEMVEFDADAVPDQIRIIAGAMGMKTTGDAVKLGKEIKVAIQKFADSIGQRKLSQMNIPEKDLDKVAEISAGPGIAMFSPKKVTKEDVMKMLKEAYTR